MYTEPNCIPNHPEPARYHSITVVGYGTLNGLDYWVSFVQSVCVKETQISTSIRKNIFFKTVFYRLSATHGALILAFPATFFSNEASTCVKLRVMLKPLPLYKLMEFFNNPLCSFMVMAFPLFPIYIMGQF